MNANVGKDRTPHHEAARWREIESESSLVPRPPPFLFFGLRSVEYMEAEEQAKNKEGLGSFIT